MIRPSCPKRPGSRTNGSSRAVLYRCTERYGFNLLEIGIPDGEKTLAAIDNLAAQGAGGFVISPPDVRLGPAILARARARGLKVFTVDAQM